jgi:hypothetical protein
VISAFVSSTFRDLKSHRAYVIERLERCGISVDPMEKWTAAGDEPKVLSTERVKVCQLFVLLVGFRRGHVPEGSVQSITQMEYAEALRCGLEVLVFAANVDADWPAEEVAALASDQAMVQWRSELMEHKVVGTFTPRPESIDVDSAVSRWLQKLAEGTRVENQVAAEDVPATIDIRAYSNSEGALIVWRADQRIAGCLGFALHCRVLGPGGITEQVVETLVGFPGTQPSEIGTAAPSDRRPIQTFRWFHHTQGEVRYRVAPVMGAPGNIFESGDARGSAWTRWITPRTGQTSEYRAYFNAALSSSQASVREFGPKLPASEAVLARRLREGRSNLREIMGGGLRRAVLGLLSCAKPTNRRIYAALSGLDDPDVVTTIMSLGDNARVILAGDPVRRRVGSGRESSTQLCRQLREASVQIYERQRSRLRAVRSNFVVVCDQWGTPISVWSGSAAWTVRALCLRSNTGILMESVPLARIYLDRWEYLLATRNGSVLRSNRRRSALAHVRERGRSTTAWNSPVSEEGDLRDVSRLIRGARQGVLFLVNSRRFAAGLMTDIRRLVRDKDLFIEGLSWSPGRSRGSIEYVHHLGKTPEVVSVSSADRPIDSTIVLVDPFGPHPVIITGSHDLSVETSARDDSDLLIIENVSGLATEYAVHLLGLFNRYRWLAAVARKATPFGLRPSDDWQDSYFSGKKRREFNFLFGSLSPGLDP